MKNNKHKTPSRERYEKRNPVWSVRMPKEWIDELEAELKSNGLSRRDFLGAALKKQSLNNEKIRVAWCRKDLDRGKEEGYKKGYDEGYKKGKMEWAIWCDCFYCKEAVFIKPKSDDHKLIIKNMEGLFCHSQCLKG
jgi:hypothetical protein